MDTLKTADAPGDTAVRTCSEGHIRVLTYKQALALTMRWAEQDCKWLAAVEKSQTPAAGLDE